MRRRPADPAQDAANPKTPLMYTRLTARGTVLHSTPILFARICFVLLFLSSACTDESSLPPGACEGNFDVTTPEDIGVLTECTSISGDLNIYCDHCTDLDGLESLTSIGGVLLIYGPALENIDGLGNLTKVSSSLDVTGNMSLAHLDGLSSLAEVGQNLTIMQNDALTNLDGLSALTSVGWTVQVAGNDGLPDCEACDLLDQLGAVPDDILVEANLDDACTPVPDNCP